MGISLENVSFTYYGREEGALHNVSLSIAKGEKVLVTGRSGSGKTTLLRCLNGIIPNVYGGKYTGTVQLDELKPGELSIAAISLRAGTVFQEVESQLFHKRVEDEIAFGMENLCYETELMEKRIETYCDLFGFGRKQETLKLSGGEKQRLLISSILAMDREYLFFDEPLSNLDREGVERFKEMIRSGVLQNRTVVIVEHRTQLLLEEMDRVIVFDEGKVEWDLPAAAYKARFGQNEARKEGAFWVKGREKNPGGISATQGVIEVDNLSLKIGERSILENLSLAIGQGEKICVLGENGAGKSTLLKVLCGISPKYTGTVRVGGRNVIKNRNGKLAGLVGYVYQNPNYQLFMDSVEKELGFKCRLGEMQDYFFQLFHLAGLRERHPHSLSEGQKRLITIGAVALTGAGILLLDEPTIGQDGEALAKIVEFLNTLNQKYATTILMVTHDYRAARSLGDRFVVVHKGRITARGGKEVLGEYFGTRE